MNEKSRPGPDIPEPMAGERIAKRIARAGLCSRREAETWIIAGRVKVNGHVLTTPAVTVSAGDKIEVDNKLLAGRERTRLWLFNKPTGSLTTSRDPQGRQTVFSMLPPSMPRVVSIGRLDMNTEGLLLFTNDGGLARVLELPSTGWLRRYRVRAHGSITQQKLDALRDGIAVDGVLYGAIEAVLEHHQGANSWLNVALREGKNREIKKVLGHLGLEVNRLIRISYGPFQLGDLPAGVVREIRSRTLRDQLGLKLVDQAGADFESPVIHVAPDIPRSEKKAASVSEKPVKPVRRSKKTRYRHGVANDGVLERMTTAKPGQHRTGTKKPGAKHSKTSRKFRKSKP